MSARIAGDPADFLRRRDGRGSGRGERIYSPDKLSQKIIGSNELSLSAIKVTRFRKNKRSDEVTKKATTRCGVGFSNAPYLREMRAMINGERRREVLGSRGRTQGRWARWTWWSYARLLRLARARRTIREHVLAAREVQREWRDPDFGADNAARGVHGVGPREVGLSVEWKVSVCTFGLITPRARDARGMRARGRHYLGVQPLTWWTSRSA
ncbi:hypothetical protein C8J57DRAFT_1255429 [Mycena rebaudengoi]|nr:hypothetical protein C8J57DRAFT_1255429 [Mycena rebaudengoi]